MTKSKETPQMIPQWCSDCGGTEFRKNGKEKSGAQKYVCKTCGKKGAVTGKAFECEMAPEDYMFKKGVSRVIRDDQGSFLGWAKYDTDQKKRFELLRKKFLEVFNGQPLASKVKKPQAPSDKCVVYPIGDVHLGLLSWAQETGKDADLKSAEELLIDSINDVVANSENAEEAYILILGDFFHTDNGKNRTERSGHLLDADSRYGKMVKTGYTLLRYVIEMVRKKHPKVTLYMAKGNHDEETSVCVSSGLEMYYSEIDDVTVIPNDNPFFYSKFGQNLICCTHGHTVKPEKLQDVMLADVPKLVGETLFRFWYIGHFHSKKAFELTGCIVESFAKMNLPDYWTHESGYRASIKLSAIALDKAGGEYSRYTKNVRI